MNGETAGRVDTVLPHRGEDHLAPGHAGASLAEGYEEHYQRVGRWKGSCGTREAQAKVTEFWLSQGDPGLRWLAGRLRSEGHIDALDGTAAVLSMAGPTAISPILEELERQPSTDQALALLRALAWIGEDGVEAQPSLTTRLETALSGFLGHGDADVREYAARSAHLLPRQRAAGLIGDRLDVETDAAVRAAIEEVIDAGATGRG